MAASCLEVTGNMGDVMKESVSIATTVTGNVLARDRPELSNFFSQNAVHIHVPEVTFALHYSQSKDFRDFF